MASLGIQCAVQLAPSAFLAPAAATHDLVHQILPTHFWSLPIPYFNDALLFWFESHDIAPPTDTVAHTQRSWVASKALCLFDSLLATVPDDLIRARLLTVSTRESRAWLYTLPISSVDLRMDDDVIHVAVGLCLEVYSLWSSLLSALQVCSRSTGPSWA